MIAFLLLLVTQAAQAPEPAPSAEAAPKVEPYAGSLREGRVELARLSKQETHDEALELSARLAARVELADRPEAERAEALYAIGLARGRAGAFDSAVAGFRAARGLAGSSELGLDALYNGGTFLLRAAELARLEVPEIREKLGLPPPPGAQGGPTAPPPPGASGPGAPPAGPDPLQVAREAYLESRAELVERWRADALDRDTRANLELVQRRLRELDEIQREREEQRKQEQEQQDQQQKQDEEQQDQQQDPQKQDQQQDPKQDQPPQDQQGDQEQEPREPEPQPDEQEPREGEDQEAKPDPAKPREEMTMTPEEIQRLLDQLQQIEEHAEQVRAMLRQRRRVPVKKDW